MFIIVKFVITLAPFVFHVFTYQQLIGFHLFLETWQKKIPIYSNIIINYVDYFGCISDDALLREAA